MNETDRQTDKQTGRQAGRQTDRQKQREKETERDREEQEKQEQTARAKKKGGNLTVCADVVAFELPVTLCSHLPVFNSADTERGKEKA